MAENGQAVIFTSIGGTLFEGEPGSFHAARQALDCAAARGVPLVLCSANTRAELEVIRRRLRVRDPFVSENGGAIFVPLNYFPFPLPRSRSVPGYEVVEFGAPYGLLVQTLHRIADEAGVGVRGFSDMSIEELSAEHNLSAADAQLAKLRDYDEPFQFLEKSTEIRSRLFDRFHRAGLTCTAGAHFYHLSAGGDKGLAVKFLIALFRKHFKKMWAIGLGSRFSDLPLLQEVDAAVVVRGADPPVTVQLLKKMPAAILTEERGPRGWNEAVLKLLEGRPLVAAGERAGDSASREDLAQLTGEIGR